VRQSFEFVFSVYDNTSAISAKVIGLRNGRKKFLELGDTAIAVPKRFYTSKEIQKRKKYLCLIVGVKKKVKRGNGTVLSSTDNKVLLFTYQMKFLGTRVYGGICKEVLSRPDEAVFKKVITYSGGSF